MHFFMVIKMAWKLIKQTEEFWNQSYQEFQLKNDNTALKSKGMNKKFEKKADLYPFNK